MARRETGRANGEKGTRENGTEVAKMVKDTTTVTITQDHHERALAKG